MTSRLVSFINSLGEESDRALTPRMERWVSSIGNELFKQRGKGLVHLFRAFQDPEYAIELYNNAAASRKMDIWDMLEAFKTPSSMRSIHDRIGMLRINELLGNLFLQKDNPALSWSFADTE